MGCSAGAVRRQAQCDGDGEQTLAATDALIVARETTKDIPPPLSSTAPPPPVGSVAVLPHVPHEPLVSSERRKDPLVSFQRAKESSTPCQAPVLEKVMNVCGIICEGLVLAGITHVFGCYGDEVLPLIEAICNHPKLTWVYTRIEVSASMVAAAYGKLTGVPGCCIANAGFGASHLTTGLIDANLDRVPVICLTGMKSSASRGREAFDVAYTSLYKAGGIKHSRICVHPNSIIGLLRETLNQAIVSQVCVHMAVPVDVQQVPVQVNEQLSYGDLGIESVPDFNDIYLTASYLVKCKQNGERMLMAIGHRGVGKATSSLLTASVLRLAEELGTPIVTTLDAKGSVPENHDQVVGVLGIFGNPGMEASAQLVASAQVVISIGVDDNSQLLVGSNGLQMTRLVEIDQQGLLDMRFQAEHILAGSISRITELLAEEVENQLRANLDHTSGRVSLSKLGKSRTKHNLSSTNISWGFRSECGFDSATLKSRTWNYDPPKDEISPGFCHPGLVLKVLGRHLPQDAIMCIDVGDCALWVSLALCLTGHSQRCLTSTRMGTMGYAIYGAIAAAAARPRSLIVGIAGDGATQMASTEFATLVQMQASVVLIIFVNGKLGRVHNETWGPSDSAPPQGCELENPDYCELVEAYGGKGFRISESDEGLMSKAFTEAFSSKCFCVIEVIQNPDVRPCMHKRKPRQMRTQMLDWA